MNVKHFFYIIPENIFSFPEIQTSGNSASSIFGKTAFLLCTAHNEKNSSLFSECGIPPLVIVPTSKENEKPSPECVAARQPTERL